MMKLEQKVVSEIFFLGTIVFVNLIQLEMFEAFSLLASKYMARNRLGAFGQNTQCDRKKL